MTLTEKIQRLKGDESRLVEYLVDRLLMGQLPYGIWHATSERRNLMAELGAELIDGVAYLCMDAIRRADAITLAESQKLPGELPVPVYSTEVK